MDAVAVSAAACPSPCDAAAAVAGKGAKAAIEEEKEEEECAVCLLPFEDTAGSCVDDASSSSSPDAIAGGGTVWRMDCCGRAVHADCVSRSVNRRDMRKQCAGCCAPFSPALLARCSEFKRHAKAAEQQLQRALADAIAARYT
jgi:hypothetical protein